MIRYYKAGFTLIELLIVVAVIGVLIAIGGVAFTRCFRSQDHAEEEARTWATKMGYKVVGVNCVSRDTDGDGYVSCSMNATDANGNAASLALECAAVLTNNDGCRFPKAMIR